MPLSLISVNHFFLVGGGEGFRVSTIVVEGLRRASRTGMYCPVRASRPILLGGDFEAIVACLSLQEGVCPGRVLVDEPGTAKSYPAQRFMSIKPQHVVAFCAAELHVVFYPLLYPQPSLFFFFFLLFIASLSLHYSTLALSNVRRYGLNVRRYGLNVRKDGRYPQATNCKTD